jgi:hypothetical protein
MTFAAQSPDLHRSPLVARASRSYVRLPWLAAPRIRFLFVDSQLLLLASFSADLTAGIISPCDLLGVPATRFPGGLAPPGHAHAGHTSTTTGKAGGLRKAPRGGQSGAGAPRGARCAGSAAGGRGAPRTESGTESAGEGLRQTLPDNSLPRSTQGVAHFAVVARAASRRPSSSARLPPNRTPERQSLAESTARGGGFPGK